MSQKNNYMGRTNVVLFPKNTLSVSSKLQLRDFWSQKHCLDIYKSSVDSCKPSVFRTFCMLCDQLLLFISAEMTTCWLRLISLNSCIGGGKKWTTVPCFCHSIIFSLSHLFSNLKNLSLYHWLCMFQDLLNTLLCIFSSYTQKPISMWRRENWE